MIIGELNDTESIERIFPHLKTAFDWIKANWREVHSSGVKQVTIDGDRMFANIDVCKLKSKEEQIFEVHRRYIDVHVPVDAVEVMGWHSLYGLQKVEEQYDEKLDRAFYADDAQLYFTVHPGEFAVMFPHDAHAPIIGDGNLKKICLKIKI